jgi:hypothetical protein
MRIPTVTVDRGGVAVVINAKDFRQGVDVLFGEVAPTAAPTHAAPTEPEPEPEDTERAELFAALAELGIRPGGRTGDDKLRAMLAEARATPTAATDSAEDF